MLVFFHYGCVNPNDRNFIAKSFISKTPLTEHLNVRHKDIEGSASTQSVIGFLAKPVTGKDYPVDPGLNYRISISNGKERGIRIHHHFMDSGRLHITDHGRKMRI